MREGGDEKTLKLSDVRDRWLNNFKANSSEIVVKGFLKERVY